MHKIILLIPLFFIQLWLTSTEVLANSLTVSPAILESIVTPGDATETIVTITNNTNFPLPIKGQANAFITNHQFPRSLTVTYNSAAWFKLSPADFILQPSESKPVTVTIKPPKDTEPGGHYATLYFEPLIPQDVISPDSTISLTRIGVLTFLIVPGDIHENLTISPLTTSTWNTFGPLNFATTFNNSGNIHLLPLGEITITNLFGQVVETLNLSPSTILPGTSSEQSLTWPKQLLFGRYVAHLTVSYGQNNPKLTAPPLIFWVIPWPLLLVFAVGLTLGYKLFIVHIDRIKLAIKVLRGLHRDETQIPTPSSRLNSRSGGRSHSPHPRPQRRHRRQSNQL